MRWELQSSVFCYPPTLPVIPAHLPVIPAKAGIYFAKFGCGSSSLCNNMNFTIMTHEKKTLSKGRIKYTFVTCLLTVFLIITVAEVYADEIVRARVFFGLSMPDGQVVSLKEWKNFVKNEIAPNFTGFNVVDSEGYWKGKTERSKIVTFIISKQDEKAEMQKIRSIAQSYVKKFKQDSVMVVHITGNREFVMGKQE